MSFTSCCDASDVRLCCVVSQPCVVCVVTFVFFCCSGFVNVSSSPLHHVLVSSSSTVLPDVQGVVGERVLGLIVVVGSQQRSRPDAHIVRRQRPAKLGRQTLGMEELVERVQVVAVEEDLRRVSRGEKVNLVTSDISVRIRRRKSSSPSSWSCL